MHRVAAAPRCRHGRRRLRLPAPAQAPPTASPAARALNAGQLRRSRAAAEERHRSNLWLRSRARAQIAQGRYQDAQTLLTPVASAQPDSDAALELGSARALSWSSRRRHPSSPSARRPTRTTHGAATTSGSRARPAHSRTSRMRRRSRRRTTSSATPTSWRRTIRRSTRRGESCSSTSTSLPMR